MWQATSKRAQAGFLTCTGPASVSSACTGRDRILEPVEADQGERILADDESIVPIVLPPAVMALPFGGAALGHVDRQDAVARRAAMLHARDHFLADEAALVEAHRAQLIEIGLVGEELARADIGIAVGDAEPDASAAIGLWPRLRPGCPWGDKALAKLRHARIGIGEPVGRLRRGNAHFFLALGRR